MSNIYEFKWWRKSAGVKTNEHETLKKQGYISFYFVVIVQGQEGPLTLTSGNEGHLFKVSGVVQYLCALFGFLLTLICALCAVFVAFVQYHFVTEPGHSSGDSVPVSANVPVSVQLVHCWGSAWRALAVNHLWLKLCRSLLNCQNPITVLWHAKWFPGRVGLLLNTCLVVSDLSWLGWVRVIQSVRAIPGVACEVLVSWLSHLVRHPLWTAVKPVSVLTCAPAYLWLNRIQITVFMAWYVKPFLPLFVSKWCSELACQFILNNLEC